MRSRAGITIIDQLLAIALLAVLLAIGMQGIGALRDRFAVRAATRAVKDALALAREHAAASGARAAVHFASRDARVVVHAGNDSLLALSLSQAYGVSLQATRDSMAYLPSGLGFGAANVSIALTRGARQDTVTISRLGRVR